MKTILITGGTGLVGKALTKMLVQKNKFGTNMTHFPCGQFYKVRYFL